MRDDPSVPKEIAERAERLEGAHLVCFDDVVSSYGALSHSGNYFNFIL